MKSVLLAILTTTILMSYTLSSSEIIPVWHQGSGAGDIQDIEFMKGHNEFILLVGVGSNAQLQIRTTETGELINTVPVGTSTNSRLAITPDSTRIIHLNGGIAQVRNIAENLSVEGYFGVDSDSIIYGFTDIAIDPIRPLAYVTIYGWKGAHPNITTKSKVSVYNYETKEFVQDLTELGDYEYSVIEVSDDGKYLAALNDGKTYLKVWDLENMKLIVNEKLYSNSDENRSEGRDIKFSKMNDKVLYLSGIFTEKLGEKDLGSGCYLFNIKDKTRQLLLPDEIYGSENLILFDNEARIFNSERTTLGVLNILESRLEIYGFPPESIYTQKVLYSSDFNYFIGFSLKNISKFQYDSQSSVENSYEEEIIISPNPTNSFVNIIFDCTEPIINYQINNLEGLLISQSSMHNQNNPLQIDFSGYTPGVYFLMIRCGNESKSYKVVRE